jgi:hypothetical protein
MTDLGVNTFGNKQSRRYIDSWELQQKNYFWQYFFNREKNGLDTLSRNQRHGKKILQKANRLLGTKVVVML